MARDHKFSFVIPRRKSSIQALGQDPSPRGSTGSGSSNNNNNSSNSNAKAHRILGSSDADVRQAQKPSKKISGLMRISESRSSQKDSPSSGPQTAAENNHHNHDNPLRQRASSPLLGNSYRSRQGSLNSLPPPPTAKQAPPAAPNHAHHLPPRSSSKLHSFYDVQAEPSKSASKSHGDLHKRNTTTRRADHALCDVPEDTVKEKQRPPRIDLSMLFPKPHSQSVPLLSPQRMTNSPSPVSVASDGSPTKTQQQPLPNKLSKQHARPRDSVRMLREKQSEQQNTQAHPRKGKPREWFDGPEGNVSDEEEMSEQRPVAARHSPRNKSKTSSPSHAHKSSTVDHESIGIPSITKGSKTSDPMATPTPASSITLKVQNSLQSWEFESNNSSRSRMSTASKKTGGSSSAFGNSNLNESSVLCLTSSDEEDEDEDLDPLERKESPSARSDVTDAEAAFGACTLGGLPGVLSTQKSRDSLASDFRPVDRRYSRSRDTPPSSGSRPHTGSSRSRRPGSSIPMISEPPEDDLPPLPANPTLDIRSPEYLGRNRPPSSNRRSRVIAVTRHEESLLEIMRQKAGSKQPNLYADNDGGESANEDSKKTQPDRTHHSRRSYQSTTSTASPFTDTSFLRLSTCSPSETGTFSNVVPDPGTSFMDSDGSASYGASDTDQRTDNSNASLRLSLIHSDTIPSPSTTSVASPLTPTLPMHKFSPQPPAAEPSPSSQQSGSGEGRRHSRTRTDSSTAIVLDQPEDTSTKQRGRVGSADLPVWAVGFRDDPAGLGVVH